MRSLLLVSLFSFLFLPPVSLGAPSSIIVDHCDFGERYQFEQFDCTLRLKNAGENRIRVSKILTANAADDVSPSETMIEPGSSVELKMRVSANAESGAISRMISFETDETDSPNQRLYAYGFVNSILKDAKPLIDFGKVKLNQKLPVRSVTLESIESGDFRVTGIIKSPDYIDASIQPDGKTISARIKPGISWGTHDQDQIVVSLNSSVQRSAGIALRVVAVGDVAQIDETADIGIVRNDKSNDYFVPLSNRFKRAFKVGKVSLDGLAGKADVVECSPVNDGCQRLRLRLGSGLSMGSIAGVVAVELPEFKQILRVRFVGMVLPPGVEPVKEEKKPSGAKEVANIDPPRTALPDIRKAIRSQVRDNAMPAPQGTGPLLKWSVADEAAVYGYYILRAKQQSGPFEKINAGTIKADTIEDGIVNTYQWRDLSAKSGQTYWYAVGTLYQDGRKEALTSPQKVVAK